MFYCGFGEVVIGWKKRKDGKTPFMQWDELNDLGIIEMVITMVITSIYECSAKSFILFVYDDGEGNQDTQAIAFFSWILPWIYAIGVDI